MKYKFHLLILPFILISTSSAKAEEQVLIVGQAEIIIPYNYKKLKKSEHNQNKTCVLITSHKFELTICFDSGKEFSETIKQSNFLDKNPDNNRKLPPGVLAYLSPMGKVWKAVKMGSIGNFDIYEKVDAFTGAPFPGFVPQLCYSALVDSPYGVSFTVGSNYSLELDNEKQREMIHKIIASIKILKGEPIKKSANKKTDFKPSFDCTKSRTFVEKTICADEYLSQLDVILAGFYQEIVYDYEDKERLAPEQRAWLKRRNTCKDADCIQAAYETRIKELCAKRESLCSEEDEQEISLFRYPLNEDSK
ncbi:MAG: hypothetical protein FWD67_02400 [Betaproteobacteria bacterium]|nr:hypothetical protein [Betaproteobacteria bacterium]